MGGELFKVGNYQMLSKKIKFFIENKKKLEKKKNYAFKKNGWFYNGKFEY